METNNIYRGVKSAIFIWRGEWADPVIAYDGQTIPYWTFEQGLWETYKDSVYDINQEPSEKGFEDWIITEGGPEFIERELNIYLYGADLIK